MYIPVLLCRVRVCCGRRGFQNVAFGVCRCVRPRRYGGMGKPDAAEQRYKWRKCRWVRKKKLKPYGIFDLLGIALGCIRLSYDDFCKLDFEEFAAVYKAYAEQRDTDFKDNWQRMRLLATIVIQPHLDKRHKVTPEKLLPFPWDKAKAKKQQARITPDKQRERMADLVKKLGDELI